MSSLLISKGARTGWPLRLGSGKMPLNIHTERLIIASRLYPPWPCFLTLTSAISPYPCSLPTNTVNQKLLVLEITITGASRPDKELAYDEQNVRTSAELKSPDYGRFAP